MAGERTLRKNIERLETDEVTALRDAYARMMALPPTDNRGWSQWAGYHGYPMYSCWHHGRVRNGNSTIPMELFLPWHRAYLVHFENTMKDQNPAASLPWWNWTSELSHTVGIPRIFTQKSLAAGKPNPLSRGSVPPIQDDSARETFREPGSPSELPQPEAVEDLLTLTSFIDFSQQLEDVHDQIHGWVGGDMGVVATAAYDPIFWSHHTMIDRLWYLWQLRHGVTNLPPGYLVRPLAPFNLLVEEVLDISRLGYEYASGAVAVVDLGTQNVNA